MFKYANGLLYPVEVQMPDPNFGQIMLEHYGGKDSEFSAATQYLNHSYNMPNPYVQELLRLIAAEELSHMEMVAVAIKKLGGPPLCYVDSQGIPWQLCYIDQSLDPVAMLQADAEAEIRARQLYDLHLTMTGDPGMQKMISFLGAREDVHRNLFEKAQNMIIQGAPPEQFKNLIREFRMSFPTS
ncbi:MAG TPA: Mn-containing catalase [Peptococcaceae bacterium]|nr:Mn-containing catalase [Peptococcaceae bacterium]